MAEDTVVQPDVLVVCKKIEKKYLDFPPVFVAEILSPSTASKDRKVKTELYRMQGVKYYCILDIQFKKLEVYELISNLYQPAAISPEAFEFIFDGYKIHADFKNLWE